MVNPELKIDLFSFQEKAVMQLMDLVTSPSAKRTITLKSPTGSGKTILLIDFVDKYLTSVVTPTAFIWLCPGKGDLEEQSRDKMRTYAPHLHTQSLFDALTEGFSPNSVTFVNWELVINKTNVSLRDGERLNLYDRIAEAQRAQTSFIIIVDEEHSNDTSKANDILNHFAALHTVRVSATAVKNSGNEYMEIDELEVIDSGLITKAIYVNEGLEDNTRITEDYDCLLELADEKRKAIAARYKEKDKTIRPLVLIQFPNARPDTIIAVEKKLESMGYTYANGMVAKWVSEDKKGVTDDLTHNDGGPVFLLMKQAISTGWDCPRAKILVKLRENMSENFEIQTVGRIRRMPEACHYDDDLLDFCYVYTLDEKFSAGLIATMDKAYETRRLFLKDKCKTFTLTKELRNLDIHSLGEREVLIKIYEALKEKYHLGDDKERNKILLGENGYLFGDEIIGRTIKGEFVHTDMLTNATSSLTTRTKVDTHRHGILLLHSTDRIKTVLGIPTAKAKVILERLFRHNAPANYRLLNLPTGEFYAFIVNNESRLRTEFIDVAATMQKQNSLNLLQPKEAKFRIPLQDFFKYDPSVKNEEGYDSNAYEKYTTGYATSKVRSTCEMLFEEYCENRDDISWVYKNGDTGQQYFSIVYIDSLLRQWLFYADYIVKKKDGSVWVIETKGGEINGENKNIDKQIANKFNAFKEYAALKKLNWGFVRYKDARLYINNTVFEIDMADEHWVPLKDVF